MASDLQQARGMCNDAQRYLATNNSHGFSDQNLEFFGAADEAKSATNAGLDYLDTRYPSKLADFGNHAQTAGARFTHALNGLNARLNELGVSRVKK